MTGWGAVCEGLRTGGPWSQAERMLHINCLELTAATLAVQAFAKDRSGVSILLQLDNQTAVAYINHLGGTVSLQLVQLAKTLAVALGSAAGHYPVSSTHSGCDQPSGGRRVQNDNGSPGLETFSGGFSENQCHLGSPRSRPICLAPLLSTEPVLQLETGSTGRSNRCLSSRLEASEGLCQPSLVLSRESSETSEGSTGSGGIGGSDLERSAVVPRFPGDALGFPSVDSPVSRSVSHDLRDSSHELSASTSRVAYLRGKFASQNLSSKARDLLLASWRTKSNKTYDSHFKKWLCWCSARGSDPVSGPMSEVANFLADLHEEGYQSSSLNVFRSAISSVHDKVDGVEVGKHPTITRLLKGAFS